MAVSSMTIQMTTTKAATAEELVNKMYKEFRIKGNTSGKHGNEDDEVNETFLATSEITCYHCRKVGDKRNQ